MNITCPWCRVRSYASLDTGKMSGRLILSHDCPECGHREITGDEILAGWARWACLSGMMGDAWRRGEPVPPEEMRRMQEEALEIVPERPRAPYTDDYWAHLHEYWKEKGME